MTISNEAVDAAARSLYKGQPIYDEVEGVITGHTPWEWTPPEYQEAMLAEARAALEAAAPIIRAEALREVAERFKTRSDTLHNTMKEMTASREYGLEDIVRYGAYSSEANTTATWLRARAAAERGGE